AGPEALNEDVRTLGEAEHGVAAGRRLQVERQRPLPGVRGKEHHAGAVVERRAPAAGPLPRAPPPDLHHAAAERGQQLRAIRAGERTRQVEDSSTCKDVAVHPRQTIRSPGEPRDMTGQRWMALLFALGSTCFLVGPFPGYAQLVGESADAATF